MSRPTLFRVLMHERRWSSWITFCAHFEQAARELAREVGAPRLADVTVGRRTFDRWISGRWQGRPWTEAAQVLEHLLGFPCDDLFAPVPDVLSTRATVHERGDVRAAQSIERRWPTSRMFMSATDELADVWEMSGSQSLDGTAAAVQFLSASPAGGQVRVQAPDAATLERFLRPARRGLLVGVVEHANEPRLYIMDTASVRRTRAGITGRATVEVPAAYLLDDLTYGLLWALAQLDDGLLADDQALDEERQTMAAYLALPRSAPSRMARPELTSVGSHWLGSAFCAQHIGRQLGQVAEPPVFWTREQTGEQASPWLFFRHKVEYLKSLADRYAGSSRPLARAFCVPEAEVARSSPAERVLLFLAIALMEAHGIVAHVIAKPEYSAVDGFALAPGRRAAVANWVRTEALWAVDATNRPPQLRSYHNVFQDAAAGSVIRGADPEARLRALAGYLGLDWAWLTSRCREVGAVGFAGLARPRSRLLTVDSLDEVLRFVGALDPGR